MSNPGGTLYGFAPGATEQAGALHQTWIVFLIAGLVVALIVYVLILLPLVLWRRRAGDDMLPAQFNGNVPLEIFYTIVPLLIVAGLFALTYFNEVRVERLSNTPANIVNVTGFTWSWKFVYPQAHTAIIGTLHDPPQLVLPLNETTRINLTSADVNHSFWVPAFLFKRDAIPGFMNHFDWKPTKLGIFDGRCAEFCGYGHVGMSFTVRVVNAGTFRAWLSQPHGATQ